MNQQQRKTEEVLKSLGKVLFDLVSILIEKKSKNRRTR